MGKKALAGILAACFLLGGCGGSGRQTVTQPPGGSASLSQDASEKASWQSITQEEAKAMIDQNKDVLVVDVRTQAEYDSGHIPGAVLVANEEIGSELPSQLPDKEQPLLLYCRSGRRSKEAAQKLADLGYTQVYEFGGIQDWPYEVVL